MITKTLFSALPINKRIIEIDILKGIVITLTIFTHTLHFFAKSSFFSNKIILISQLTSFSCFVFSFGFACYKAYINKPIFPRKKIFLTAAKIYTAFIISGLSYRLFIDNTLSLNGVIKILLFMDLPGYSEFLVFYFFITILVLIFGDKIKYWMNSKKALLIVSAFVLLSYILPSSVDITPLIGIILRGHKYAYFPVIPYLPIFILGMYCAKGNIYPNVKFVLISIFTVVVFFYLKTIDLITFDRFPPSILWLILCICFINIMFFLVVKIYNLTKDNDLLLMILRNISLIGYNTLFCFLGSNIMIFVLSNFIQFERFTFIGSILIWGGILSVLHFFYKNQNHPK